jgi:CRP-like cAMP-binding protein
MSSCLAPAPLSAGNPALRLRLDAGAQADLDSLAQRLSYPADSVICAPGAAPPGVFLVLTGAVSLLASRPGVPGMVVRNLGPGEAFGLSAALCGAPMAEAAVARRPAQLAFIPAPQFREFLQRRPAAAFEVLKSLSEEAADAHRRLAWLAGRKRIQFHARG